MRQHLQVAQELEQTLERKAHNRSAATTRRTRHRQAPQRQHDYKLHRWRSAAIRYQPQSLACSQVQLRKPAQVQLEQQQAA